jgi:hypothetical protein
LEIIGPQAVVCISGMNWFKPVIERGKRIT